MTLFYRLSTNLALLILVLALSGCASTDKSPLTVEDPSYGNNAVADALQLQGYPYVYGGESPKEGFDCSGLVFYVYKRQGVKLPRTASSLAQQLPVVQLEQRQPGDLLFFHTHKPYSHVGIYIGGNYFIHAPSSRTGRVMISSLQQPYWHKRFVGVRRPIQAEVRFSAADNFVSR